MLYNRTHALAVNVDRVSLASASGGWRLSYLACNLLWPCTAVSYPSLFSRTCLVTLYY